MYELDQKVKELSSQVEALKKEREQAEKREDAVSKQIIDGHKIDEYEG